MKKKTVSFVIAGFMLAAFAGCGSVGKGAIPTPTTKPWPVIVEPATPTPTMQQSQTVSPEITATQKPTETPMPTAKPTKRPTAEATKKPTATPKPTKKPAAGAYKKGTLTGNSYESEWIGLRFTAPKGTKLTSQKEMDENMRLLAEALGEIQPGEALDYAELSVVYEIEAEWPSDNMTMLFAIEKLEGAKTIEEYADETREELELLTGDGISYIVDDEIYPVTVGGQEFYNFGCVLYYGDEIAMCQENYFRIQDDRLIGICFIGENKSKDNIQKVLNCFSEY